MSINHQGQFFSFYQWKTDAQRDQANGPKSGTRAEPGVGTVLLTTQLLSQSVRPQTCTWVRGYTRQIQKYSHLHPCPDLPLLELCTTWTEGEAGFLAGISLWPGRDMWTTKCHYKGQNKTSYGAVKCDGSRRNSTPPERIEKRSPEVGSMWGNWASTSGRRQLQETKPRCGAMKIAGPSGQSLLWSSAWLDPNSSSAPC